MKEKPLYLLTVIVSVLLVFIGHRIAVQGLHIPRDFAHEIVRARVEGVVERTLPEIYLDAFEEEGDSDNLLAMLGERLVFHAEIRDGVHKGRIVTAEQSLGNFLGVGDPLKEVTAGDRILLIHTGNRWFFLEHVRTNKLAGLAIIFALCILVLGGKKGFNTILSLSLTCAAVFAVFIPSILSGMNIYIMAALVCAYTTIMTLSIVIGFNKKSLAAAVGCLGGILVTGIITVIMNRILFLTGIVDEHSRFLATLQIGPAINLRAIIFAGIIIGAMGAIMDVAMSISSSLWEVKEEARNLRFETLFRSGLNIGRDIMGSMANTLILAYIGTSLSVVLVLGIYSSSLTELFNREMIVVEVLKALAGSFGILFAMPLTAFACATIYLRKEKPKKRRIEIFEELQ